MNRKAMKTAFIRARMAPELKNEIESMFDEWGITTSQFLEMLYKQIKRTRTLPLDISFNQETEKALQDAKKGNNIITYKNAETMFKALKISSTKTLSPKKRVRTIKAKKKKIF